MLKVYSYYKAGRVPPCATSSRHKQWVALAVAAGLLLSSGHSAFAATVQHDTITGQFLTIHNGPRIAQQQLMQQTFEVHFPMDVLSVGDAIQYLLQTTGYRLVMSAYPLVADLMRRPLPDIDRNFGPMTIQQGLQALVGEQFQLLIDPVHREIAFRVKPTLRTLYPAA